VLSFPHERRRCLLSPTLITERFYTTQRCNNGRCCCRHPAPDRIEHIRCHRWEASSSACQQKSIPGDRQT
jgi:hypothetical protein